MGALTGQNATRPMTLFPREGFILLSEFLCQSLHIRPRFHHLQSIEQRLVLDVAEPPQAGPNRSRPARCAWLMTDCHAAALKRSRQPGPTTSRGARGSAGNWLAGYESGAYDLISLRNGGHAVPNGTRQENTKREQDRELDRELEDTFPASDPPNITRVPYERRFTSEPPAPKSRAT
jgi:hypothetical protein